MSSIQLCVKTWFVAIDYSFFSSFSLFRPLFCFPIFSLPIFTIKKIRMYLPLKSGNTRKSTSASFSLPPNLASAQSDNYQHQPSAPFSLFPNVAFAQTTESENQPSASFSLFPNVAFAQTTESENQPSASFSLTVSSDCLTGPSGTPSNGNDILVGSNDPDDGDSISGGGGNDNIQGCAGNDSLNGNNGNDVIDGGEGDDKVFGNNGDDTLTGGPGADEFECGNGIDTITDYESGIDLPIVDPENCENITIILSPPTIDAPETVTDCEDFTVSGTTDPATTQINLYIDGNLFTSTTDITPGGEGEPATWEIILESDRPSLG